MPLRCMELLFKVSKVPCQRLKHFIKNKNKQTKACFEVGVNTILYTYKGGMIQFKYKYLKINEDVNTTGNRRVLAEGKEANLSLNSESKLMFGFSSWGYSKKL